MKQIFRLLSAATIAAMMCVFSAGVCHAAALVEAGSTTAVSGGKLVVPVRLTRDPATAVGGIQFSVSYDASKLALVSYASGPAAQGSGGYVLANDMTPGRLEVGVMSGGTIADGILVNLTFSSAAVTGQPLLKLAVSMFIDASLDSVPLPYTASDGVVTLVRSGDCDASGGTSIAEVQSSINMFLGLKTVSACVDSDADGVVSIAEVQRSINSFLGL